MSSHVWLDHIESEIAYLKEQNLERNMRALSSSSREYVNLGNRRLLNLSSSNYLGLANHPDIISAMKGALDKEGSSTTSSRLIAGHTEGMAELEQKLAHFKKQETALLFSSGYMANLGILSALLGRGDAVISDKLNHASIVDGIKLSGAMHLRYRHNDLDHLERCLVKAKAKGARKILVVTDTLFSMDGDTAPLPGIVYLKNKYGAALLVDEAHAEGVLGEQGRGLCNHYNIDDQVDLHMGTFSKAFGIYGGYIAGKRCWIEYLVNRSRPFIYTTSLPPVIVAGITKALELVISSEDARQQLRDNSRFVRGELTKLGLDIGDSQSHIIPIIIGSSSKTLCSSESLLEQGILVPAIRPPTVLEHKARLRISIMASHSRNDLQILISAMNGLSK